MYPSRQICSALLVLCTLGAPACGGSEPSASAAPGDDAGRDEPAPDEPALDDDDAPIDDRTERDASAPRADAGASAPRPDASRPTTPDDGGGAPAAPPDPEAPFPRTGEVSVAVKGPYAFERYTEGLTNRTYASSVMYYPKDAAPPYAAIVFSPGFTATKESYTKLGEIFASHGFAMLLTTPTSTGDFPDARGVDLEAAVAQIGVENERTGSPLRGKLSPDRVCVTGHSMGGGGTLWGASTLGSKVRCAVPLQPWQPGQSFARIVAPTLFIAAENDTIAGTAANAWTHYRSIPDSVDKIYAEFRGADHFFTTNRGARWDEQATVMVAFYKLHLEDDARYRPYLFGAQRPSTAFSRFESSKK